MSASKNENWYGNLRVEPGWAHYRGPIGDSKRHAHYAVQLIFSSSAKIMAADDEVWSVAPNVRAIPSGVQHLVQATSEVSDLLFVEPKLFEGNKIRTVEPKKVVTVENIIAQLESGPLAKLPERFAAIITCPNGELPAGFSARDAAASLGLSRSHFSHLFQLEMGLPFRQWVLWTRLKQAVLLVMSGENHTYAAHAVGFSDSAHLARTMRRMFGISISALC
jgi:AraC-like DNA-binding protein